MISPSLFWSLILLHSSTSSTIHYVIPYNGHVDDGDADVLDHYLNNTDNYFTSDSQLCFLPGEHILSTDLILENINNFALIGNNSATIHCISPVSVMIINVTSFKFENINLVNCGRSQSTIFSAGSEYLLELINVNHLTDEYIAALFLYNCTSSVIKNTEILVGEYCAGVITVNLMNRTEITKLRIKVQINCSSMQTSYRRELQRGVLIYYNDGSRGYDKYVEIIFSGFLYKIYDTCLHKRQYALKFLLHQSSYNVSITIQDTVFSDLIDTTALFYQTASCQFSATNRLIIASSIICDNIGNPGLKMFDVKFCRSHLCTYNYPFIAYSKKGHNIITFKNCSFVNNINMGTMIYITPKSPALLVTHVLILQNRFIKNNDTHFMKVKSVTELSPWLLTTNISIHKLNASFNTHQDGNSLISLTNGYISFKESVINENHYYENILQLHQSVAVCSGYSELVGNHVRQVLKAKSGSYFITENNTIVNMSNNVAYMVTKQIRTLADDAQPICPLHFWSSQSLHTDLVSLNVKVLMLNNTLMVSKCLRCESLVKNCAWLDGFIIFTKNPETVYQRIILSQNIVINKTGERLIPLSVCPCVTSSNTSCYSPNLGSLFPGQTLKTKLIVRKQTKIPNNSSTTLVVANTPDDDCSIIDSYQLSQAHLNTGCNEYTYTIWPSHKHVRECVLFIGLTEEPEMFYVQIKPCPKGFSLYKRKKSCSCEQLLSSFIRSCDLDKQTVFRDANIWLSADTLNDSHTYHVSIICPFDYCLPHSSHLDLANPDMQCQFKRSGVLCGYCQQGLSTVFGSSQCKHCSSIYALVVVPIAVVEGILLVIMLFLFNITVTSGTIVSYFMST